MPQRQDWVIEDIPSVSISKHTHILVRGGEESHVDFQGAEASCAGKKTASPKNRIADKQGD